MIHEQTHDIQLDLESVLLVMLLSSLQLRHQLGVLQCRLARLTGIAASSSVSARAASVGLLLPVTHAHVWRSLHVVALLSWSAVALAHSLLIHT